MKKIYSCLFVVLQLNIAYSQKFLRFTDKFNLLDTSICGASYNNFESIINNLSKSVKNIHDSNYKFEQGDFGTIYFSTLDGNEYLDLTVTPGNQCCQFFKVYKNDNKSLKRKIFRTKHLNFLTENDVKIGMTQDSFFKKYPIIMFEKITLGKFSIFRYFGDIFTYDDIVYSNYVGIYKFKGNKLVEFLIGSYDPNYDYIKSIMNNNSLYLSFSKIYSDAAGPKKY